MISALHDVGVALLIAMALIGTFIILPLYIYERHQQARRTRRMFTGNNKGVSQ